MTGSEPHVSSFSPRRLLTESWLGWGLLYLALVVLPCWLSHSFLANAVNREEAGRLRDTGRQMNSQAQALGRSFHAGVGFQRFNALFLGQPASAFLKWVTELEETHPGGFRWIAWDGTGKLLEVPVTCRLPGSRYWSEIAVQLAKHLSVSNLPEEARYPFQLAVDRLQPFYAKTISLSFFFQRRKEVESVKFLGQECFAGWISHNRVASDAVSGIVLFALLPRLPEEFFLLQSINPQFMDEAEAQLAAVNLREPTGDLIPKTITDPASFAQDLRTTYRDRQEQTFRLRNYLVHPLPAPVDQIHRLFLLTRIDEILGGAQERREFWKKALLAVWFFGTCLMLALFWGAARHLSLRLKIAGLFFGAICLPLLIFLQTSLSWDALEWESGVGQLEERLREAETILQERWKDFPVVHAHQQVISLQRALENGCDQTALVALLDSLVGKKHLSGFYLTDERGEISVSRPVSNDAGQSSVVRVLVKHTFFSECGSTGSQGVLQGALTEEMNSLKTGSSESGEGQETGKSYSLRVGHLKEIDFRTPSYFLYLIPRFNDQPRVLMLQFSYKTMRAAFGRSEFEAQRFLSGRPPISLEFSSNEGDFPDIPERSPVREQRSVADVLGHGRTFAGEISVGGQPTLCLVSGTGKVMIPILTTSLKPLLQERQKRHWEMLALGGTGAGVALLLGVLLSGALLGPIKRLEWAMDQVGSESLEVELPVESRDELGRMNQRFNEMVRGLRERERMRAYVSDSVQEKVKLDSAIGAHTGEAVQATIFFSDIRGFTTLCEKHPPQEIFRMLNDLLGGADRIIREEGGHVDKFIGDAVMAVFFRPGSEKALGATRAAVRLLAFLDDLNQERRGQGRFEVKIGIGINTGLALMGDVGSETRKDLTVIGDAVNLAARLESTSKEGRHTHVILSESTVELLRDVVEVEELSVTSVKGKEQAVRMFELVLLRENPSTEGDKE